jgi:hypothetical protein
VRLLRLWLSFSVFTLPELATAKSPDFWRLGDDALAESYCSFACLIARVSNSNSRNDRCTTGTPRFASSSRIKYAVYGVTMPCSRASCTTSSFSSFDSPRSRISSSSHPTRRVAHNRGMNACVRSLSVKLTSAAKRFSSPLHVPESTTFDLPEPE